MRFLKTILLAGLLSLSSLASAQKFNTLNADAVIDMNGSTAGTALTSTIANTFVHTRSGASATFQTIPTNACNTPNFEVGANQGVKNLGPVQINGGGTLYAAGAISYNSIGHNDACTLNDAQINLGGTLATSVPIHWLFPITITATGTPAVAGDFDMSYSENANSPFPAAVVQFVTPNTAGSTFCNISGGFPTTAWGVRIEMSNSGLGTIHAPCIALNEPASGQSITYWVSMNWDVSGFSATEYVYTQDGTPVACVSGQGGGTAGDSSCNSDGSVTVTGSSTTVVSLAFIDIGNNEAGKFTSSTFTYFGPIFVCGSSCSTPYFWQQDSTTDPSAGVLAPPRTSDWTNAGVSGGIPSGSWSACTTTACNTVTASGNASTTSQINSAITSAKNTNTCVVLPAGTYTNATTPPTFTSVQGECVKGTISGGVNATIFQPTSEWFINNANTTYSGNATNLTTWTPGCGVSGANPYTTTNFYPAKITCIILASVANLKVGGPIMLDQVDPNTDYGGLLVNQIDSGGTGVSPGLAGPYSSQGNGANIARGTHGGSPFESQEQLATVISCNGDATVGDSCAGTNVTVVLSDGLEMINWGYDYGGNALTDSAWWPSSTSSNFGLEDITLDMTNCSGCSGIHILFGDNVWVKGAAVINCSPSDTGCIRTESGHHVTIENSYVFGGVTGSAGVYGFDYSGCSECSIVNNIAHGITTPFISNSATVGTVIAYNVCFNGFYTAGLRYNIPGIGDHGSGISKNLYEGNFCNGITEDTIHGTANLEVYLRNVFPGQYPVCADSSSYTGTYLTCNQNMTPMNISVFHRFASAIENVLGSSAQATYIIAAPTFASGSGPYGIYQFGGQTLSQTDNIAENSMMRWGNVDAVNGFSSPRNNCSEVANGTSLTSLALVQYQLFQPCPSSNTVPASFAYSSEPTFLTNKSKPWPLIGADVSSGNVLACSGGTYDGSYVTNSSQCSGGGTTSSAFGGHVNSNPAWDCAIASGMNPYGTNGVLSFSENCYSNSTLAPPTNIQVIEKPGHLI